jgi:hypothetical protein
MFQSYPYLALPAGKTCLMDLLSLDGKSARVVPHKLDHGSELPGRVGDGWGSKRRNVTMGRLACHLCVGVETIRAAADECLAARVRGPRALFECRNSIGNFGGPNHQIRGGAAPDLPFPGTPRLASFVHPFRVRLQWVSEANHCFLLCWSPRAPNLIPDIPPTPRGNDVDPRSPDFPMRHLRCIGCGEKASDDAFSGPAAARSCELLLDI